MLEYICFIYSTVHIKGIAHPKKMGEIFHQVVLNLCACFLLWNAKIGSFGKCLNTSSGDLCRSQKSHRWSKRCENFQFGVNYPFKQIELWRPWDDASLNMPRNISQSSSPHFICPLSTLEDVFLLKIWKIYCRKFVWVLSYVALTVSSKILKEK